MSARPAPRIVGRGAVSCFGAGANGFLDAVFAGRAGLSPLRRMAGSAVDASVAGEVPAAVVLQAGAPERLPLAMALSAASEALDEARLPVGETATTGLVLATTKADLSALTPATPDGARRSAAPHAPGFGSAAPLADELADALGLHGPRAAVSCACASGLSALALAGRWLTLGSARRVLVVGVDALCPFILEGFGALLALDPGPCRPFDRRRRGLSLGEGAGALLLVADVTDAPGCVLAGWGESNDGSHVTRPRQDGAGLALAIERALARGGLAPDDVDLVHLHGTGTVFNDAMEGHAVGSALGRSPPACSSKGQIGHTLGASGVLESLVTIEALRRGVAPGSVGLDELDPQIPLDIERQPRPLRRARTALKLAAGFGGINAALVFRQSASA